MEDGDVWLWKKTVLEMKKKEIFIHISSGWDLLPDPPAPWHGEMLGQNETEADLKPFLMLY